MRLRVRIRALAATLATPANEPTCTWSPRRRRAESRSTERGPRMTHGQHSRRARVASEPMTARAHTSRQRQALVLTATVALLLASASAVTAQAAPLRLNAFVSHLTI
jgi:alpha-beta hydrolase superfamily lysophospholipase